MIIDIVMMYLWIQNDIITEIVKCSKSAKIKTKGYNMNL